MRIVVAGRMAVAGILVVLTVWMPSLSSSTAIAATATRAHPPQSVPRAPSGPPLSVAGLADGGPSASAPPSGGDVLVDNGLSSPLCNSRGELPASAARNCETADFVAAADPTGNYALDVNINTGTIGNDVATTIQNSVGLGWMTFVVATHGLVVMFEWCYSLNLLSGPLLAQVAGALRSARLLFTDPWLAFALSVAAALAVHHGLLRRRVADTLAQALAMGAMMGLGLWLIADPAGTVAPLGRWADQAGLDAFAVVASGAPSQPQRTLAGEMQTLFAGVVAGPWCFLEFGAVEWCRSDAALDPRLHAAALAIARREQAHSGCAALCGRSASAKDRGLAVSAELLRSARNNGELFLALPANELERNSVTTEGALLNVLCGRGEAADKCGGPTAAQAEYRSERGTSSRVVGLVLVWVGGLGMLLLFGCIALRLLTAALLALLYLLLAPVAVLAPAFGDGGRAIFRVWGLRLLEALVAKLIYSFLLGAALVMTGALLDLTALGWIAQWLLMSAFWWTAFCRRVQVMGLIDGSARGTRVRAAYPSRQERASGVERAWTRSRRRRIRRELRR